MWHHPPRQILGAVLLEAGRAADAEAVYREDLQRFRENGWSLFGLRESLRAQRRATRSRDVQRRFERAWTRADITSRDRELHAEQDRQHHHGGFGLGEFSGEQLAQHIGDEAEPDAGRDRIGQRHGHRGDHRRRIFGEIVPFDLGEACVITQAT